MHDFEYEAPSSLADAIALLDRNNGSARPLAGGTDLIDQMRIGRLIPDLVIDIKKLPELNVLKISASGLQLGAAVPCCDIYGNAEIASSYAALCDSCRIIGGIQIQNRASVGGNLCNSGPAADSTPALIVLDAICVIDGADGRREVPVAEFCTGPGENVLTSTELLTEIRIPVQPDNSGSHYRRFIPRNEMDIAVVGVGAQVVLDSNRECFESARIALGAVGPTPLFARDASHLLAGQPINDESIGRAVAAAQEIVRPIDDMRGTREFRRHLAGVLVDRVLKAAVARARGETVETEIGQ